MKKLLLISNSSGKNQGYLDYCAEEIQKFLGNITEITFVPFAIADYDMYEKVAKERFAKMGITLTSIHHSTNQKETIEKSEAVFIGGGNTFRLLNQLYKNDLIEVLQHKIENGMPYIGTSAGSNMACPTIKTTNDMPIIYPPSFDALNVIPFQINPHYLDPEPNSIHNGETRAQRIKEYLEENNLSVVGLREQSWILIEDDKFTLGGFNSARIFEKNKEPYEVEVDSVLSI